MKDIKLLHPSIIPKAEKLVRLSLERFNLRIKITMTLRSAEEQTALYAKGRYPLLEVNRLMSLAGLPSITPKENKIVTKAKFVTTTFHGYGLAFDIAVLDQTGKKIVWDASSDWNNDEIDDWAQVGSLAEECGLEWGGNWTSMPDAPHYQDRLGWTIAALREAMIPAGKTYTGLPFKSNVV